MTFVSIITPLHNKGPFIVETLASVKAQDFPDWEMIVVENHSSDDGPEQVERFAAEEPRLRLVRAPSSVRGPGAARNFGLSEAQGDWVLFLDADDLIAANHLASLCKAGRSSHAHVVASDWLEFVDGSLNVEVILNYSTTLLGFRHHASGSQVPPPRISVHESSIAYAPWAVHCGLIRHDAIGASHRWVEALDEYPSEDTAFWFRLLCGRQVAYTRVPSAIYRTKTPNFRNINCDLERWAQALEAIHAENVRFLQDSEGQVSSGQAECLMRVWSKIGEDSKRQGLTKLASYAYQIAEEWMCSAGWSSPSLVMRQVFGCQTFDRIRAAL